MKTDQRGIGKDVIVAQQVITFVEGGARQVFALVLLEIWQNP